MFATHTTRPAPTTRRFRIVIVTESFLPQINGVTNSVCRIVEQLHRLGHHVDIIAPTGPQHYDGARVHRVNSVNLPGYDSFSLGLASPRRLREIFGRLAPDVVHVASPIVLGGAAIKTAKSLNIPVVSIYQTDLVGLARRYRFGGAEGFIERQVRRIHNASDLTLAPSSASVEQLEAFGVRRVRFWPRGIDTERFSPTKASPTVHAGLTRTLDNATGAELPVLAGYVGRLAKEKNLHHLASLQQLAGVQVVLVGDGPERDQLHRVLPKAIFLGSLQGEELATLMASLDIFIHPGADETFCQAVQEALASGVPAVGPASGGLKDRIQHGRNGLHYSPGQVVELRAAVERLAADQPFRDQLGATAREAVLGLSWESITKRLIGYYLDAMVISGGKLPAPWHGVATAHQHAGSTAVMDAPLRLDRSRSIDDVVGRRNSGRSNGGVAKSGQRCDCSLRPSSGSRTRHAPAAHTCTLRW